MSSFPIKYFVTAEELEDIENLHENFILSSVILYRRSVGHSVMHCGVSRQQFLLEEGELLIPQL